MSAFNIPNWREQEVSGKVELPPELPHDLIELPSIDATAPKRLQYMAKGGRWSFDRHLQNLPRHGVGELHRAIHSAVLAGLAEGQNSAVIHYLVRETALSRGRPRHQADQEVRSSLINAHRWLSGIESEVEPSKSMIPKGTKTDWNLIDSLVSGECTLDSLRAFSGEVPTDTATVLSAIFSGDELICCGTEMHNARTQTLVDWLSEGVSSQRLVVPNPMAKPMGINQQSRVSARCLDNTGPRRFLVVEFDFAKGKCHEGDAIIHKMESLGRTTADMNAALHAHLQEYLPLAMVVFSGGNLFTGGILAIGCQMRNRANS